VDGCGRRQALRASGTPEAKVREFDRLAEAVAAAANGDTIEVHGNGIYETGPIKIVKNRPDDSRRRGFAAHHSVSARSGEEGRAFAGKRTAR